MLDASPEFTDIRQGALPYPSRYFGPVITIMAQFKSKFNDMILFLLILKFHDFSCNAVFL